MSESLALVANGIRYTGWRNVTVSRSLTDCCSSFTLEGEERFLGGDTTLPLAPFTPVTLYAGSQKLLTGYIFGYRATIAPGQHNGTITGRSRTAQLVDCTPDIASGQFQGYSLAAIAPAVCNIFNVTCAVQTTLANEALADATLERGETAFRFIDRLATLSGVLAFDDATGALVLGNAGSTYAGGALVQGENIAAITVSINGEERFSTYIVKGQAGITVAAGASGFPSGAGTGAGTAGDIAAALATPTAGQVQTQQRAVANDSGVPLYRPKIIMAEGQLTQAQLQIRANWQRSYHFGHSLKADITVPGWFQPDGTLWQVNQLVPVTAPQAGINDDLLVLAVEFTFSLSDGHRTRLTVGPVDGAIPSPSLLKKNRRKKGRGGAAGEWSGVVKAS